MLDAEENEMEEGEAVGSPPSVDRSESAASINPDDEEEVEDDSNAEMLESAMRLFAEPDYIMEPAVFGTLAEYFQAGGKPEPVVAEVSKNFVGQSQMCNLVGDWLLRVNDRPEAVQEAFEQQLAAMTTRCFQPKLADRIFEQAGADRTGIEWLPDLVAHGPWRALIYALAEQYPECLMLNFAVKLISDAGYQHEISNVTTATQQLEIFSRVLSAALGGVLSCQQRGADTAAFRAAFSELLRVASHSETTYLYTQCLLHRLSADSDSAAVRGASRFMAQSLRSALQRDSGCNDAELAAIALGLLNTAAFAANGSGYNPALLGAMQSMLNRQSLNPADMSLVYNWFAPSTDAPPPLDLIRDPLFVDLLVDALYRPRGTKIHADHWRKYVFVLARATCPGTSEFDVDAAVDAVERTSTLCQAKAQGGPEILAALPAIFQAVRQVGAAMGVLHWIDCLVQEPNYFQLHPEPVPIHLALLDELCSDHHLLCSRVLRLLVSLFDKLSATSDDEDSVGELLLDRQRSFIDRFIHLLSVGHALPVTEFVAAKFADGTADTSLVRYFVTETLEIIAPPYSAAFVSTFLPLVQNEEIVDESVKERWPIAVEFLEHCKS